jgi:hypothetical protein
MKGTGRLFASGMSLQAVPKVIKRFALHGMWEYDFSNCHFTIIQQLAAREGMQCPNVADYLARKKAVRAHLAREVGASVEEIKECLIRLAYGAGLSLRPHDAVPDVIGVERAQELYADPLFRRLHSDLVQVRPAVIKPYVRHDGTIRNVIGLDFDEEEKKRQKQARVKKLNVSLDASEQAHVLQGIEADALLAIVRAYGDQVLLLEHDGFVSRAKLEVAEVQRIVADRTGFDLRLEEAEIALPSAAMAQVANSKKQF